MNSKRDQELLCDYAQRGSEAAFTELVRRYVDLVHSAAFRMVGNPDLAQEVTQSVFVALSQNARPLARRAVLSGWLHRTAQNLAAKAVRTEVRRRNREQEAAAMNELTSSEIEPVWERIAPHLDLALGQLKAADRDVVLLRFFERRSMEEIGRIMGLSEAAARKRLARALERLKGIFVARGVTASSGLIASALGAYSVQTAPAGLAAVVAGVTSGGAAVALGGGLSATLLELATMTKMQASVLGAVVLIGTTTSVVIHHRAQAARQAQDQALERQSAELARHQAEHDRLSGLVQAGGSRANNLDDLVRISNEVASLRKQTNGLAAGLEENRRLQALNARQQTAPLSAGQMMEEDKKSGIARMKYVNGWGRALWAAANTNNGRFPTNFDEARPFLAEEAAAITNLTAEQFEILYRGALADLKVPPRTVVLREKQPHRNSSGSWTRTYGFADGHAEVAFSADGNFDAWEQQHNILPPPGQ